MIESVAPTLPSVRSEVFKPCVEDKDLAFCLNDGECSIIETVAGVHRHCRCKEGYHGLRCDQFVPKTDAILSDPKSGDTYQRQVLSIFSIASGICLLGVACMALYRRNKRHREKLQAHLSDSRSLRDCSVNASGLMSKSTTRSQYNQPLQKQSTHGSCAKGCDMGTSTGPPAILSRALSKGKRFRSSSLSLSPAQQRRETSHHFCTPPISRGKHKLSTSLMEGNRVTGHVYKHLQEEDSADMESVRRCDSASGRVATLLSRTSLSHFAVRKGWTEVPCTHLDKASTFLPPSLRTRSVPIIPSLQAGDLAGGRMQLSDQKLDGQKGNPAAVGKTSGAFSSPACPPSETVVPVTSVKGTSTSPYSTTTATTEKTPASIEMELRQDFNWETLSCPVKIYCSDTNTHETGSMLKPDENSAQHPAKVEHTGTGTTGLKAAGQREAQGRCQGQTNLVFEGANCSLAANGPSCRASGTGSARPSAS